MPDVRGVLLFCKAWHLRRFLLTSMLSVLAWLLVPSRPLAVPARDGVESLLWPLVPTLVAGALPTTLAAAYRDSELTAARSRLQLRGAAFLLVCSLSLVVSLVGARFDIIIAWRNTGFLFGLALLSTAVQAPSAAWLPICAVPMWMWLLGTDLHGTVETWAVLLHPSHSRVALTATVVLLALGATTYLTIRTPRRSRASFDT